MQTSSHFCVVECLGCSGIRDALGVADGWYMNEDVSRLVLAAAACQSLLGSACPPQLLRAAEARSELDVFEPPLNAAPQLRVANGLGTHAYGTLRVSLITAAHETPPTPFDHSAPFAHRWTHFALHSSLVRVVPGMPTPFQIGTETATLTLPLQGVGVAGVLIADPCTRFASITSLIDCMLPLVQTSSASVLAVGHAASCISQSRNPQPQP